MQKHSAGKKQDKPLNPRHWDKAIKQYLTSKKKLHVLSYQEISKRLRTSDIEQSPQNLSAKFNQGKLSASLFVSSLLAMGEKKIDLLELAAILEELQKDSA